MKKFVAYYRVSTARQGASGLGLEAQERSVAAFAAAHGAEVVAAFTEIETGTRKGNSRPQLAAALAYAKRHRATLVIAKLDRLARNVHFVSGLMESGVDFLAVDVPSANRLVVHIMAAVAEEEARLISRRTKDALAAAKARGVRLGTPGNLPAGAGAKGREAQRQEAVKAYSGVMAEAAKLRDAGMGYRAIAAALNDAGHLTRRGLPFNHMTVKRIIERS